MTYPNHLKNQNFDPRELSRGSKSDSLGGLGMDWIQSIDRSLVELDERPQFKRSRTFPFEEVTERMRQLLQDDSLNLTMKEQGWVEGSRFSQKWAHSISVPPLQEPCFLLIEARELIAFIADESMIALPKEIAEPFVSYFLAEMMHAVAMTAALKPLGMRLQNEKVELTQPHYYQVDLCLSGKKGEIWMVLLFTPAFRDSWNAFFADEPSLPLTDEQKERLQVDLGVAVGKVRVPLHQLKEIEKGDFLLIENCSYDPETKKGKVSLTLNKKPLFRGEVKEGRVTLVGNS